MTPERLEQIGEILENALAHDPEKRANYLDQACANDSDLRREVESLLASHERAGSSFLNAPATGAAETIPRPSVHAGRRIGAYDILEQIGHGGMGEVFSAVRADGQYEKKVAIKLVRRGLDTESILERFRIERQILATLDHPNIASLLDGGTTDDGIPYLVMELVEGIPIDDYCDSRKLNVTSRLELFRQVCAAVQYAHQRLVIHRDLKPSNILVTPEGSPKLLDFGIAKLLDASGSTEATVLRPMTPEYASPEQIRGETITTASDVYSLGVVIYQLLTGHSPYRLEAHTPAKLAEAITGTEPERPSTSVERTETVSDSGTTSELTPEFVSSTREASPLRLRQRLRGDLDFILLKALRKEPARRYASVDQFAQDIRNHLEGLPVAARKGTWNYRAGKFIQRHKVSAAAAALVLVTLIAGVAITLREARIAEANRRRAEARFNDVRKLANSLIFDVHDSIADLPGATKARNLILTKALEYLDSLAKESGNEPDLLRELATAYQRIGALQGNGQVPNLGDSNSAQSSMSKAIELREKIARLNPNNRKDQLSLASIYMAYSEFQTTNSNNTALAYEYIKKSLAILDREIVATPNEVKVVLQSTSGYYTLGMMEIGEGAMGSVGTVADGIANLKKSAVIAERAVPLAPDNVGLRIHIALIDEVLGDASFRLGDRQQALTYYQSALRKITSIDNKANNVRVLSNTNEINSRMGDIYFANGELQKCVANYTTVTEETKKLLDGDPSNETLRNQWFAYAAELGYAVALSGHISEGLAYLRKALAAADAEPSQTGFVHTQQGIIHDWTGEALELQGKGEEAFHEYETAKRLFEELRATGANDQRIQIYYALTLNHFAASLSKSGKSERANHEFAESVGILEPLSRSNQEDMEVRCALADAYTGAGTLTAKIAESETSPQLKLAQWQSARARFQQSLSVWQQVPNPGFISPTGFKTILPDEVSRRLAKCNARLASLNKPKP
jgi:eukaryotic-like serine/threonine-protein kinase